MTLSSFQAIVCRIPLFCWAQLAPTCSIIPTHITNYLSCVTVHCTSTIPKVKRPQTSSLKPPQALEPQASILNKTNSEFRPHPIQNKTRGFRSLQQGLIVGLTLKMVDSLNSSPENFFMRGKREQILASGIAFWIKCFRRSWPTIEGKQLDKLETWGQLNYQLKTTWRGVTVTQELAGWWLMSHGWLADGWWQMVTKIQNKHDT